MMDLIFLFTLIFSILVVFSIILIAIKGFKSSSDNDDSQESSHQLTSRNQVSSSSGLRHRRVRLEDEEVFESDEDDEVGILPELPKKIGAKKQRKLEMKAEKKLARERELQEREERKRLMEEQEKQRKLEEEKQAAEEKAQEELERLEKEKKIREEHEMYLKLRESFKIDEEGFDGDINEEESQSKLQSFIDYIQDRKVVHMDELAGNFNLKTQDVVQRIQDLLLQELLIGVIDDRGKFIYISNDELQSVAKFIKQRGRVSLSELAENSNNLIKLIPVYNG